MVAASVIVPARNAEATVGRTLRCLVAQDAAFDYEVVVVDDGSTDRTKEIAEAVGPPVRVLHQEATGPAEARNLGVRESSGGALAFIDADCFAQRSWLAAGVGALDRADLVQGRVRPEPGVVMSPFDRTLWISKDVGLWETANLFVTRELFDRVGGFEDWLLGVEGKTMAEDLWFGWRAKRAGARSVFCADALAYHAVFQRRAVEYIEERRRVGHFPEIVARVPELRGTMLHLGFFLNRRTMAFDIAVTGAVATLGLRRLWPLAAALPYLWLVRARARTYGHFDAKIAAVDAAADVAGAYELLRGSLRSRTPVL